ncbi:MAG: pyridoxamine 5'-phosphate oxidase family protein [Jatrophihabitantaceae bacterium]
MADPVGVLDARFSSPGATAPAWSQVLDVLQRAEIYWITTVDPAGAPHVTPLIGVWQDDALHFCTGATERKALNLAVNPQCALTTGTNAIGHGLDVVVHGEAMRFADDAALNRLAEGYVAKYGEDWRFEVAEGAFGGDGRVAVVFQVRPSAVHSYGKGEPFSQTRWTF